MKSNNKRVKLIFTILFVTTIFISFALFIRSWNDGVLTDLSTSLIEDSEEKSTMPAALPKKDLADIKEAGVLRAITTYSATSYFLYKGEPMGFEYELLENLAEYLEVELELVIAKDLDDMFEMLNQGKGDLVAHGLTVTQQRKEQVAFTQHHLTSEQVLVQHKPKNWRKMKLHKIEKQLIRSSIDLGGETVHVRKNSAYSERLRNLEEEIGEDITIETVSGEMTTNEIIRKVAEGKYKYTIADDNIAAINKTYYNNIDIETPISLPQKIAWAVRKNSPDLLIEINLWLDKIKREPTYNVVYNKYFKNKKAYITRVKSDFYSKEGGKISQYDEAIQHHATSLRWDWRFLASMIYQESQFDPEAKSWVGAKGLMQIMPATGKQFGVVQLNDPQKNLKAGTEYLDYLYDRWKDIPDSIQQIKFTLASYNVGRGHVLDAQRLAKSLGKNPNLWDKNVEDCVRLLSQKKYYIRNEIRHGYCRGEEPYQYVQKIFKRYNHYAKFIPRNVGEESFASTEQS